LSAGQFGENLTTSGLDVSGARIGEQWTIGDVVLQVTAPRIPCATFRGWMNRPGWLKAFTESGRPGAYLRVQSPGLLRRADSIVVERPDHDVTIALAFRALTTEPGLLPLLLAAPELPGELREMAQEGQTFSLG
jgi:MOSC domain-containing protein YiiM